MLLAIILVSNINVNVRDVITHVPQLPPHMSLKSPLRHPLLDICVNVAVAENVAFACIKPWQEGTVFKEGVVDGTRA